MDTEKGTVRLKGGKIKLQMERESLVGKGQAFSNR
jgi:hypothetical protein